MDPDDMTFFDAATDMITWLRWQWLPGMQTWPERPTAGGMGVYPASLRVARTGGHPIDPQCGIIDVQDVPEDAVPHLHDPATLGCIEALIVGVDSPTPYFWYDLERWAYEVPNGRIITGPSTEAIGCPRVAALHGAMFARTIGSIHVDPEVTNLVRQWQERKAESRQPADVYAERNALLATVDRLRAERDEALARLEEITTTP